MLLEFYLFLFAILLTYKPTNMGLSKMLLEFYLFLIWPRHVACEILVPRPGIEPVPLAVKAQRPNCWTAREFPASQILMYIGFNKELVEIQILI